MLSFSLNEDRLAITDDSPYDEGSADNLHSYDVLHSLDGDTATSRHALRIFHSEEQSRSCLLSAGGGATGVHEHTAIIHGRNCIIAVGPFMASIALPTFELNWATQADDATCFGVYESEIHNCLLSHGELSIARLTYDGKVVWQAFGADIFTNGFQLDEDVILVTDFYDRDYVINIESGREIT